jgi:glycosyltransferase involved in cell wall biosynthesis
MIPAYNEEETIAGVLTGIPTAFTGVDQVITLVVDDGSSDNTAAVAKKAGAILVSHSQNRGVGCAFTTGLQKALELGADILVNIDADGQFSPDDITMLIDPILKREADFVVGDRFTNNNGKYQKPRHMSRVKFWGNKLMARFISTLIGNDFKDVSCGFRAYSREAMLQLNLAGQFTYTQETFMDLASKGLTIKNVPISVTYFPDRQSRVAGSLVNYAFKTGKIIFRAYRDYKPLRFFGWLGLITFGIGLIFGLAMLIIYLQIGTFTPYKFIGVTGIYFVSMGIIFWIVGLLADMFVKVRQTQEKILYFEKKRRYGGEDDAATSWKKHDPGQV